MKARKKPVVVEVMLWDGDYYTARVIEKHFGKNNVEMMEEETEMGGMRYNLLCHTLENDLVASIGDYIIQGVHGEVYPCKPDIFHKTYDLVD